MSNIDTGMNTGINTGVGQGPGAGTRPFEGMEEQHQDLGGAPGGVRGMASKAGETILDTAERQKAVGADYVDSIAGAVRRAAGAFEGQAPQAADYIRYAADRIEGMSDSLRRRDLSQMLSDVQSFARRQPTAFLGLSFIAGFAAIRFLRSGSAASAVGDPGQWQGRAAADDGRYGSPAGSGLNSGPGM